MTERDRSDFFIPGSVRVAPFFYYGDAQDRLTRRVSGPGCKTHSLARGDDKTMTTSMARGTMLSPVCRFSRDCRPLLSTTARLYAKR